MKMTSLVLRGRFAVGLVLALSVAGCPSDPDDSQGVGAACEGESDCQDELTCIVDDAYPGGYCAVLCDEGSCPEGSECRDLSGLMTCLAACKSEEECRDGYSCNGGVCDLPCVTDAECPGDEVCLSTGACFLIPNPCAGPADLGLGCACPDDPSCQSGSCLPPALGGTCTEACADEDDCPAGLACGVVVITDGMGGASLEPTCVPERAGGAGIGTPCNGPEDCRSSLCYAGACTELCDGECPKGFQCLDRVFTVGGVSEPLSLCVDDTVQQDVVELGSFQPGATGGTGPIPFLVPEGVISLTLIAEAAPNQCAFPLSITDPDGVVWYSGSGGGPNLLEPSPNVDVFTLLIPDRNTSPPIVPGLWEVEMITLSCFNFQPVAGTINRLAIYMKSDVGGVLDLNIHFTPASGVMAADATADIWVAGFINRFWELYAPVGVIPGNVTFFDAPAGFNTLSSGTDLRAMCASESEPGLGGVPAVNIFVIGGFTGELGSAAGISPGAPGSFLHDHVSASCVAVEALTFGSDLMGVDVAHEVGHFLSMQHTSEFGGLSCGNPDPATCYDNISDTPECSNPSGMSSSCGDYTNVMFPSLNGVMTSFSPGQSLVLSGAPVMR